MEAEEIRDKLLFPINIELSYQKALLASSPHKTVRDDEINFELTHGKKREQEF